MEILFFTLNAIVVYLVSDWVLRMIEQRRGKVLPQRRLVFFGIFLILILVSFQVLKSLSLGD